MATGDPRDGLELFCELDFPMGFGYQPRRDNMLGSASQIARSGLTASATAVGVAAHNLANQQTRGFKSSRAVFAEQPPLAAGANQRGGGVYVAAIEPAFPSANAAAALPLDPSSPDALSPSDTDIAGNLINLELASMMFLSNLAVISTEEAMLEALLNVIRS